MADKRKRPRGKSSTVPTVWLDQVREYRTRTGKTLKELAAEVSEILGRRISHTTIHDYLMGRVVTQELTDALAQLMKVPPPASGGSIVDEELEEWCDLGRRLKHEAAERFRREIIALREVVETLERYARR